MIKIHPCVSVAHVKRWRGQDIVRNTDRAVLGKALFGALVTARVQSWFQFVF